MTSNLCKLLIAAVVGISVVIAEKPATLPTKQTAQDISYGLTNMACRLSVQLQSNNTKTDIISPLSIGSSLMLLMRTAKGSTRKQLLSLLQLQKIVMNNSRIPRNFHRLLLELLDGVQAETILEDPPRWMNQSKCVEDDSDDYDDYPAYDEEEEDPGKATVVRLANAIFVQDGMFNNSRLERKVKQYYYSTVENLDFFGAPDAAMKHINEWANNKTYGRIPSVLSENPNRETLMMVANAVYFKAFWEDVFLRKATKPRDFFPNGEDKEPVKADMMAHNGCFPYYSSKELDARIMGFPYIGRTFTMYVIQPNNSSRTKLQDLMGKLNAHTLDGLISNMTMRTAMVLFPRMDISNSFELKPMLEKLGVTAMFNDGQSDFSLLNPGAPAESARATVNQVIHKVKLTIDENGTEGAAVTVTLIDRTIPAVNFRANTPFVVAIRHDATKLLLFYGPVYDPSG
ncbi:serine protease inhibitor 28Dc-like isoform X2 [Toxorhynchites rutilus septentrionalis]|nr:serine protease inhibitor 28Dc-like isoform X2 [Toxorhynchites rutilus septentrionalis]XP_055641869.1 serine protease inhibitor 28Dc-like isoform X2 [Toxorhynchites rutilus septentrionalis]